MATPTDPHAAAAADASAARPHAPSVTGAAPMAATAASPFIERREVDLTWRVIATAAGVSATVLGATWHLSSKLTEMTMRLDSLDKKIDTSERYLKEKIDGLSGRIADHEGRLNKAGISTPTAPLDGGAEDASADASSDVVFPVMARCEHSTIKVFRTTLDDAAASKVCLEAGRLFAQVHETKAAWEFRSKKNALKGTNLTWTAQAEPTVLCSCTLRVD